MNKGLVIVGLIACLGITISAGILKRLNTLQKNIGKNPNIMELINQAKVGDTIMIKRITPDSIITRIYAK